MADTHLPRTPAEQLIVEALLEVALIRADALPQPSTLKAALSDTARREWREAGSPAMQVLKEAGPDAKLLVEFNATLKRVLDEARAREAGKRESDSPAGPEDADPWLWSGSDGGNLLGMVRLPGDPKPRKHHVEHAGEALQRQAVPELLNEILAGGAVAASFTAAAGIAKAKLEATTQRQKNTLDAETERLRIESNERIASFQGMRAQIQSEDAEPDGS
ncbi:hypothetical protein ACTWJ8_32030 [Streptomyces sp. SDT5-1]|uniref:hypothetical protein n=1 Tax=Streptomyces sp. SDT5-1 TaxID=3406418 RepID=UPI003FD152B5